MTPGEVIDPKATKSPELPCSVSPGFIDIVNCNACEVVRDESRWSLLLLELNGSRHVIFHWNYDILC